MLSCVVSGGEQAGRLDHDVSAEGSPRDVRWVSLRRDGDALSVDDKTSVGDRDLNSKATLRRVLLEKVSECLGRGQVVDGHNLDVSPLLERCADEVATDSAEAVDTNTNCHDVISLFRPLGT